jgi:tetratricopeptide (TPR) repeat protein
MSQPIDFTPGPEDPDRDPTPEECTKVVNVAYELVAYGAVHGVEPADAVGMPSSYVDALHELAHYQSRQFDSAAKLYQTLIALKPFQLPFHKGLGACCLGLERYDAAIKAYNAAVMFGALDAELHYYLGQAYYFNKEYEPAFDLMRFARVLDEQDPNSKGRIAGFATQMLERLKTLVSPEQAALIDLRPS